MKNFPFEYEGNKYWYSRSVVVGIFVYAKNRNGEWCVLANKRGKGCPCAVGKWNCPGGFLDFDENIYQAAIRECYEETGVSIRFYTQDPICWNFNSEPTGSQNISFKMYAKIDNSQAEAIYTSAKNSEKDEVEEIQWIPISKINNYDWAFNHKKYIIEVYNKYINPNLKQKIKNYIIHIIS